MGLIMGSTSLRKTKIKPDKMSDRQVRFAHEYMVDLNATRAATEAGYKQPGRAGAKLLKTKVVADYIGYLRNEKLTKVDIKAEDVLRELAFCIMRDPKDLCDDEGYIDTERIGNLPERIRKTIDSIKQTEHYTKDGEHIKTTTELKLASKISAIDLGMKHLGLLTEKHEHKHLTLSFDQLYGLSDKPDLIEEKIANA